ncbi:MAG: hypothetical protein Kow00127_23920 [Bacteroidales bacterium]
MWIRFSPAFIIVPILLAGCGQPQQKGSPPHPGQLKEPLIKINKTARKSEDERINAYCDRHKWQMELSQTGLRYHIYTHGDGEMTQPGDTVTFNYIVTLLSGDTVYSSDQDGPKTVVLGKAQIERGLEEGILMLCEGDRAKFILPSHLAFGLVGDGRKIPARAALVYDIELLKTR